MTLDQKIKIINFNQEKNIKQNFEAQSKHICIRNSKATNSESLIQYLTIKKLIRSY